MKTLFTLITTSLLSATSALAVTDFQLNFINTNDCEGAKRQIMMLSNAEGQVVSECSEYRAGGYRADNGKVYDYRIYSVVRTTRDLSIGETIQLNFINTNDCEKAQRFANGLGTATSKITAVCSPYQHQGYESSNGRKFDYRLFVNFTAL
jgi:hypothetical protein